MTLTFDLCFSPNIKWVELERTLIGLSHDKFDDCSFSLFADKQTHTETDADEHFNPAPVVGVKAVARHLVWGFFPSLSLSFPSP